MKPSFVALLKLGQAGYTGNDVIASRPFLHIANLESALRGVFTTTSRYYGLGDETLQIGDKICVLFGGDSLFVIREVELGYYQLVGEAHVRGIIHGEHSNIRSPIEHFMFC